MFDLTGFSSFAYVEFDTELHVWLNSNQSNRRPDVQQYFPLQSKYSHICLKVLKYLESLRIFNYFMVKSVKYFSFQVEPEANYSPDSFVGIAEFKNEYMLVGGINAPKQIKCRGTDGKWRTQLVKGLHFFNSKMESCKRTPYLATLARSAFRILSQKLITENSTNASTETLLEIVMV